MRVGILTGGGDCPGLNAVIRAAVRKGIFHHNDEFVGFIEGWRGVVENKTKPLTIETVSGILQLGGTILRTSRTNPRKMEGGIDKCLANIKANRLDALIPSAAMTPRVWPMRWSRRASRWWAFPRPLTMT